MPWHSASPWPESNSGAYCPMSLRKISLGAIPLEGAIGELNALNAEYGIGLSVGGRLAVGSEQRLDFRNHFSPLRGVVGLIKRRVYECDCEMLIGTCHQRCQECALSENAQQTARQKICRVQSCEGGAGLWVEQGHTRDML